jgi:hypothetical protein
MPRLCNRLSIFSSVPEGGDSGGLDDECMIVSLYE